MSIRAVLIAIERYDSVKRAPAGPCQTAYDLAARLLAENVPGGNIHLFASPPEDFSSLPPVPANDARFDTINRFWRKDLPKLAKAQELLLFFWAGHGITIAGSDRVFFCSDFSKELNNYAVSLSDLCETLSSTDYARYAQQLMLFDTCANRVDLTPRVPSVGKSDWARKDRYLFFAAEEGEYATSESGRGLFSQHLVDHLKSGASLADPAAFAKSFRSALDAQKHRYYVCDYRDNQEQSVSEPTIARKSEGIAAELIHLLQQCDLDFGAMRELYWRTIERLRVPALWQPNSLPEMVNELANLTRSKDDLAAPRAMIEFALRIERASDGSKGLSDWAKGNASPAVIATLQADFTREQGDQYLVIELLEDVNHRGSVVGVDATLFPADLSRPLEPLWPAQEAKTWNDVVKAVQGIVKQAESRIIAGRLQIQFVVSAPLLACAPHEIVGSSLKTALGATFPTMLRSQERFWKSASQLGQRWRERANLVRSQAAKGYTPVPLPGQAGKAFADALKSDTGIYFLKCAVMKRRKPTGPTPELLALKQAVESGVPYMLWFHSAPAGGSWDPVCASLKHWLEDVNILATFPAKLCDLRQNYEDFAGDAAILWDDPERTPRKPKLREMGG